MARNKNSRAPYLSASYKIPGHSKKSAAGDICNYDHLADQERKLAKFQEEQRKREANLIEVVVKTGLSILVPKNCDVRKRIKDFMSKAEESRVRY